MAVKLKKIFSIWAACMSAFIILWSLSFMYTWALLAVLALILIAIFGYYVVSLFLQIKYGGFGPIPWPLVWTIRQDKRKLWEQEHPYIATGLVLLAGALFLGYILYSLSQN